MFGRTPRRRPRRRPRRVPHQPAVRRRPTTATALRLRLRFPSDDYEEEYGACRQYLPDDAVDRPGGARGARSGPAARPPCADLVRRRVIVDLPKRYY